MAQPVNPVSDSHMHIVKTTAQWNDRAIANWVVPRGCLCIELTTDLKTKIKIGEGNKFYHQLPYVGGDGGDLSNYYTKQEIDMILKNLDYMSIKSINEYPSPEALPKTGNKQGDVRFVRNQTPGEDPYTYLWNGLKWIGVTGIVDIDLSEYAKKSEVNPRLNALEQQAHTHANKPVVDQLTQNVIDDSHKHTNETVLDQVTQDVIDNSHGHTNKTILDQVTQPIIDWAHKHDNIVVLNGTTASYTIAEKEKLAALEERVKVGVYDSVTGNFYTDATKTVIIEPDAKNLYVDISTNSIYRYDTSRTPAGYVQIVDGGGGSVTYSFREGTDPDSFDVSDDGGLSWQTISVHPTSYIAGDGIAIEEADIFITVDITDQGWIQGSIDPSDGSDDDFDANAIRSEFIKVKANDMIFVSAQDTNANDLLWQIAFYKEDGQFISMTDQWYTIADGVPEPVEGKKIRVILTLDHATIFDESMLNMCEISIQNRPDTYVIKNTGVTNVALNDKTIQVTKNGITSNLITFGQDLNIVSGEVNVTDWNRLTLNVET